MFHVEHRSPGELLRDWLTNQYERGRLQPAKLARALNAKPQVVHHWLSGRRVRETYWNGLAAFFDFDTPEALLAAAREALRASQARESAAAKKTPRRSTGASSARASR